jgi:hypothetical protein
VVNVACRFGANAGDLARMNNAAVSIQAPGPQKGSRVEQIACCGPVEAVQSEPRSEMLRALSHQFPENSDSVAIAGRFVRVMAEIRAVLSPVVGARGVTALLQRSLQLAGHRYASLPARSDSEDSIDLQALHVALAALEPAAARAAVDAVLQSFHELLTSLIGASLTERLFDSVWASPPSGNAAQEPKP